MNKENMLQWAEALESGDYHQFQGGWGGGGCSALCCLNVALVKFADTEYDLLADDEESNKILNNLFGFEDMPAEEFFTSGELSRISESDAQLEGMHNHFMVCNDELRLTFPEIAAKIRKLVE